MIFELEDQTNSRGSSRHSLYDETEAVLDRYFELNVDGDDTNIIMKPQLVHPQNLFPIFNNATSTDVLSSIPCEGSNSNVTSFKEPYALPTLGYIT